MKSKESFKIAVIIAIMLLAFISCCLTSLYIITLLKNPSHDASVYLAIFNLAVDMTIGILTVWGLAWTAQEFQASQEKSELDLIFLKRDEQYQLPKDAIIEMSKYKTVIDISKIDFSELDLGYLRIGLENSGTVIGLWYRVKLETSVEVGKTIPRFQYLTGHKDNWHYISSPYIFKSLGKEAVFPDEIVSLCSFWICDLSELVIDYQIVTDKTKPKTGTLTIKTIKE